MSPKPIQLSDPNKLLSCGHAGCVAEFQSGTLNVTDGNIELSLRCTNGHMTAIKLSVSGKEEASQSSVLPPVNTVKTKVSGVTFENSDGTSRQELLRHIRPGDTVSIKKAPDNAFYVKHALGVIGVVKRDAIRALLSSDGLELSGKVTHVTGGSEGKPTLGCNIEITIPEQLQTNLAQQTEGEKQRGVFVFMDPEGRNIFHGNKYCSGMQNAKPVQIKYARSIRARPCKKCAAEYAAAERK